MRWFLVAICLFAGVAGTAHAGELNDIKYLDSMWSEEFDSISKVGPKYLSADMAFNIPEPPTNDSAETKKELDQLNEYYLWARTEEQMAKIIKEQWGSSDLVFGLGEDIPEELKQEVAAIRQMAQADVDYFIYREKRRFKRPRPTQLVPTLPLAINLPGSPAYPSGHATIAWFGGRVYSYIDPENQEMYMKYAGDVGTRRAISGIHYPSDSTSGQILADQVFEKLMEVEEFRRAIDLAKKHYQEYKSKS